MIHIMKEKHAYQSQLREEQMKRTRAQILEGLIRVMANGIIELSIPAVAREAGVSVPTVYRYFRTKRELVEALPMYLLARSGVQIAGPPQSPEELAEMVRRVYYTADWSDEAVRAAALSEASMQLRKEGIPARLQMIAHALAPVQQQFNETDWQRLCRIVLVLSSSAMLRAFSDYLDITGEEAADVVTWAMLTLTHGHSSPDNENMPDSPTTER